MRHRMTATAHPPSQNAIDRESHPWPPETANVTRPEGRVAHDVADNGPLLVLVPGMGNLRGSYRFLALALRQAGYRQERDRRSARRFGCRCIRKCAPRPHERSTMLVIAMRAKHLPGPGSTLTRAWSSTEWPRFVASSRVLESHCARPSPSSAGQSRIANGPVGAGWTRHAKVITLRRES